MRMFVIFYRLRKEDGGGWQWDRTVDTVLKVQNRMASLMFGQWEARVLPTTKEKLLAQGKPTTKMYNG